MIDSKVRTRVVSLAAAALATVALAACSSSKPSGSSSGSSSPHSTAATSTGTPSSMSSSTPSGAPSSADAATVAAITHAYQTFFAPGTSLQTSMGLLQNGAAFKATLDQQGNSSFAKKASASVADISLVSADTAKLKYTISVGGQPMLKDQTGYAVREGGTWKIADYTFCGLMTLQGTAPAACKTPAATTPPK